MATLLVDSILNIGVILDKVKIGKKDFETEGMGAANKVSGNKITGNKVLKKI